MAVKGKPYKGPILTCLVFLIIYNFYVRDLERKNGRMGSELYKTLHLLKFRHPLADVQGSLQVPRVHTHSQNKTLCKSVS